MAYKSVATFIQLSCFLFSIMVSFQLFGQSIVTDSVLLDYKHQIEQAKHAGKSKLIAQKYHQLGTYYDSSYVYIEAVEQYNQALKYLQKIPADTLLILVKNNIGKVYLKINNFDLAAQYFKEALIEANRLGYTYGKAISKSLLGTCFEKKGDYLQAIREQKESLRIFLALNDSAGIATVNENIGSIYEDLLQYDLAFQFFTKAYQFLKQNNDANKANILNNLGDIHRKKGNFQEAIYFTQQALKVAEEIKNYSQLESANKDISEAYASMGDYLKAYQYLQNAEAYEEMLMEQQSASQLKNLQIIYDTKKKEAQIELLKEQNQFYILNNRLMIFIFGLVVLILALFYFFSWKKRKERFRINELEQLTQAAILAKKNVEEQNLQQKIHLKTTSLSRYSLHIAQKNKILLDLSDVLKKIVDRKGIDFSVKIQKLAREIDANLQEETEWEEFVGYFNQIHPNFNKKLADLAIEKLTPAELRLGALLLLNLSSKEIASILRITPDSVRVARYRLRKKLPIDLGEDLVNFLLSLK